jgi:hypothetical protein
MKCSIISGNQWYGAVDMVFVLHMQTKENHVKIVSPDFSRKMKLAGLIGVGLLQQVQAVRTIPWTNLPREQRYPNSSCLAFGGCHGC